MPKYPVLANIMHDNAIYGPDIAGHEVIELSVEQAQPLIQLGRIGPALEPRPPEDGKKAK